MRTGRCELRRLAELLTELACLSELLRLTIARLTEPAGLIRRSVLRGRLTELPSSLAILRRGLLEPGGLRCGCPLPRLRGQLPRL
ncbi:hypothetical protein D5S18_13255 [Nocardia panacis]|uniref:Uncharacterized protein n=1 Tax=Nocardia panacis TaxID=2340916 RepID=A0A3A4K002_9NOCA|nr:hypothetical protein D5S18_13255 [Nocardia panacis]